MTVALSIGALHANTTDILNESWVEEAILAHIQGRRPVLVGDISQPDELLASLARARSERPQIRFALLLHFSQVLNQPLSDLLRAQFDEVFVAVDRMMTVIEADTIRTTIRPRWILLPTVGLDWNEIIIGRLFPDRRGIATVLCPPSKSLWNDEGPFLSPDELLIHIQEFQDQHPLIELRPPPHEWFVPCQTEPWKMSSRNLQHTNVIKKSEELLIPNVSFIIPLLWKKNSSGELALLACLHSCLRVVDHIYAQSDSIAAEYILCIDRELDAASFNLKHFLDQLDPRVSRALTIIDCPRQDPDPDWRAGFIRNAGAAYSRIGSSGSLVFVDSDVEIVDVATVAREVAEGRNSLVFSRVRSELLPSRKKPRSQENQPFQLASSRLMIVRRSLFENLGGFACGFRTYGCEDNFLVWQTTEILRKGLPVSFSAFPFATTRHLRASADHDDLPEKMVRLKAAAELLYRMTFDPRVHRHFFVAFGQSVGLRFIIKRLAIRKATRSLLGPIVFGLTLFETKDRTAYLKGFWEILKWKAKRPLLLVSSEAWRISKIKHVTREHGWKVPHVFARIFYVLRHWISSLYLLGENALIKTRATRFGWTTVGWRLKVGLQRVSGELNRRMLVFVIMPVRHVIRQLPWVAQVAGIRMLGQIRRLQALLISGYGKVACLGIAMWGFIKFHWNALRIRIWWDVVMRAHGLLMRVYGQFMRAYGAVLRVAMPSWGFIKSHWNAFRVRIWWDIVMRTHGLLMRGYGQFMRAYGAVLRVAMPSWGFFKTRSQALLLQVLFVGWGKIKLFRGLLYKLFVDQIWYPGLYHAMRPYHFARRYSWMVPLQFRKLAGELWRINVYWMRICGWWKRMMGRLWFIPVGYRRLKEKILRVLKYKGSP